MEQLTKLKQSILNHKNKVSIIIYKICDKLEKRAINHDNSKLSKEELNSFLELDANKNIKFGEYSYSKHIMAITHHNKNNSHHPEFFKNGIKDMSIIDLVEMFSDWAAYSSTTEEFMPKLDYNSKRFQMSDDLKQIFFNSFKKLIDK